MEEIMRESQDMRDEAVKLNGGAAPPLSVYLMEYWSMQPKDRLLEFLYVTALEIGNCTKEKDVLQEENKRLREMLAALDVDIHAANGWFVSHLGRCEAWRPWFIEDNSSSWMGELDVRNCCANAKLIAY